MVEIEIEFEWFGINLLTVLMGSTSTGFYFGKRFCKQESACLGSREAA